MRSIELHFTVEDPEHWTSEHRNRCEAEIHARSYDDWVVNQLEDWVREAGMIWQRQHPDLFAYEGFV
jgi:hypothetical protein